MVRNHIRKEATEWLPKKVTHWLMAVSAVLLIGFSSLTVMNTHLYFLGDRISLPYYPHDEFVVVYDYTPHSMIIEEGTPITVSYLYTKEPNCIGQVSYYARSFSSTTGDSVLVYTRTFGPYAAAWPEANSRTWIVQQFPRDYEDLEPGQYEVFWQAIGTCGEDHVFTRGPITNVIIE